MKRCQRLVSSMLCMAMLMGLAPTGASANQQEAVPDYQNTTEQLKLVAAAKQDAAFPKLETYTEGQFWDVKSGAWYENTVKTVYERGLMRGTGEHTFNPNGTFTLAEAATIAANLHSRYYGKHIPATGGAWYQKMVNYCVKNGIISGSQFTDYTRPATRAEMAGVLAAALPESQWKAKNHVTALPDVNEDTAYRDAIFKMYNAGVLAGKDAYGTFDPRGQATRAEVAAITARCAVPEERVTFSLKPYVRPSLTAYVPVLKKEEANIGYFKFFEGFFYDLNGDGVKEMIFKRGYESIPEMDFCSYAFNVYTIKNGKPVIKIDRKLLYADAGGPGSTIAAGTYNGRTVLEVEVDNGETGGGGCKRDTVTTLYSGDTLLPLITITEYYYDGTHDYSDSERHPYAWKINGKSCTQAEYQKIKDGIHREIIDNTWNKENPLHGMTLDEMIDYAQK